MTGLVKICGLSSEATLDAALSAGADMIGLNFFARSPRYVEPEKARALASRARGSAAVVALVVNPAGDDLKRIVDAVEPEYVQLHGAETPVRVAAIRECFGRPVVKALGVAVSADFAAARAYENVADQLLIDAKPPPGAILPGGNGVPFDWRMARSFAPSLVWLLSGGLDAGNVGEAIALSGARGVDVSSGVESAPGVKDAAKIRRFIEQARLAFAAADRQREAASGPPGLKTIA